MLEYVQHPTLKLTHAHHSMFRDPNLCTPKPQVQDIAKLRGPHAQLNKSTNPKISYPNSQNPEFSWGGLAELAWASVWEFGCGFMILDLWMVELKGDVFHELRGKEFHNYGSYPQCQNMTNHGFSAIAGICSISKAEHSPCQAFNVQRSNFKIINSQLSKHHNHTYTIQNQTTCSKSYVAHSKTHTCSNIQDLKTHKF